MTETLISLFFPICLILSIVSFVGITFGLILFGVTEGNDRTKHPFLYFICFPIVLSMLLNYSAIYLSGESDKREKLTQVPILRLEQSPGENLQILIRRNNYSQILDESEFKIVFDLKTTDSPQLIYVTNPIRQGYVLHLPRIGD